MGVAKNSTRNVAFLALCSVPVMVVPVLPVTAELSTGKFWIHELATCRFIRETRDVLLLGPPGPA